jgi:dipeptidyl aminopeptidase/acylaminoacyl peptidase
MHRYVFALACIIFLASFEVEQQNLSNSYQDFMSPVNEISVNTASAVAWSPDGRRLAVGYAEGINIYTSELELILHISQATEQMKTLAWSPDMTMIAAGGGNDLGGFEPSEPRESSIFIWDADRGDLITRYDEHESYVPNVVWSPDGNLIASSSWDRTIRIWEAQTGKTIYLLYAPDIDDQTDEVMSMDWSAHGQIVAAIGANGVFLWDSFREEPKRLPAIAGSVAWNPSGQQISLGSGYFDLPTNKVIAVENCSESGYVAWSPSGLFYATYTWRDGIVICDPFLDKVLLRTRTSLQVVDGAVFGYQYALDWHSDGTFIASAGGDGAVRIWDVSILSNILS